MQVRIMTDELPNHWEFLALVHVVVAIIVQTKGPLNYWGFLILSAQYYYVIKNRTGNHVMQFVCIPSCFLCTPQWLATRSAGGGLNYENSFLVFFLCVPHAVVGYIGRSQMGYIPQKPNHWGFLIMLLHPLQYLSATQQDLGEFPCVMLKDLTLGSSPGAIH